MPFVNWGSGLKNVDVPLESGTKGLQTRRCSRLPLDEKLIDEGAAPDPLLASLLRYSTSQGMGRHFAPRGKNREAQIPLLLNVPHRFA